MNSTIRIERAAAQDGRFITQMIAVSSDGIACIGWQREADETGVDSLDIGARKYTSGDGDYSYRNCWIARNAAGFDNTSLVAVASKIRLIAYYESLGFRVKRRAPIVEHPQIDAHGEALLMETRPVESQSSAVNS